MKQRELRTAQLSSSYLHQVRHTGHLGEGGYNPSGCWDCWGFLGDSEGYMFATKQGRQMAGVAGMVGRVAGIDMFPGIKGMDIESRTC